VHESKFVFLKIFIIVLIPSYIVGCKDAPIDLDSTIILMNSPAPTLTITPPPTTLRPTGYEFPDSIDPSKQYLFYIHGKIIEDQGIPAVSPDFGEYKYQEILESLAGHGFVVISEIRPKNTDDVEYARRVSGQVIKLIKAGVPAGQITVVGASKGAAIAV